MLLNVKKIKLNSSIFSNTAFINLHDSSILLSPSGDEGRLNPFAPIGFEASSAPSNSTSPPSFDTTQTDSTVVPVAPTNTIKGSVKTP